MKYILKEIIIYIFVRNLSLYLVVFEIMVIYFVGIVFLNKNCCFLVVFLVRIIWEN